MIRRSKSVVHSRAYERFLDWASPESVNHVAVVAIPQDLAEIQGNVCLRAPTLLTLLRTIAPQHPAEIVIDKYLWHQQRARKTHSLPTI